MQALCSFSSSEQTPEVECTALGLCLEDPQARDSAMHRSPLDISTRFRNYGTEPKFSAFIIKLVQRTLVSHSCQNVDRAPRQCIMLTYGLIPEARCDIMPLHPTLEMVQKECGTLRSLQVSVLLTFLSIMTKLPDGCSLKEGFVLFHDLRGHHPS